MDKSIELLRKCAIQFRYYAQEHLKKTQAEENATLKQTSRAKSAINLSFAEQIEDHLREIHNATHPLRGDSAEPITTDNMSREDWQRSLGL